MVSLKLFYYFESVSIFERRDAMDCLSKKLLYVLYKLFYVSVCYLRSSASCFCKSSFIFCNFVYSSKSCFCFSIWFFISSRYYFVILLLLTSFCWTLFWMSSFDFAAVSFLLDEGGRGIFGVWFFEFDTMMPTLCFCAVCSSSLSKTSKILALLTFSSDCYLSFDCVCFLFILLGDDTFLSRLLCDPWFYLFDSSPKGFEACSWILFGSVFF